MTAPVLLVDRVDGVATLTLNRPDQMNALSLELREALHKELDDIRRDKSIYVVILTGAGRGFCAGLDLKEMGGEKPTASGPLPPDPASLLRALPQPVIGAINGVAVTGGLEISLSCDLLIGTPATRFADTHARVGLIAGWGLGARLSHVIGPLRAKEMSLTGNFLNAEKAYDWGLLNRIVSHEELIPTCQALARDMLSTVPDVMLEYYRQIDRAFDLSLGDAMRYEADFSSKHGSPTPETVAERRRGVQSRGRDQQKP